MSDLHWNCPKCGIDMLYDVDVCLRCDTPRYAAAPAQQRTANMTVSFYKIVDVEYAFLHYIGGRHVDLARHEAEELRKLVDQSEDIEVIRCAARIAAHMKMLIENVRIDHD